MRKSRKNEKKNADLAFEAGSGNIFKDLGFPDAEAANLFVRGQLAIEVTNIIRQRGWSQRQAAEELGVPQPRIAEIMKLKLDLYSVDTLLKYLDKLGQRVSFVISPKDEVA